MENNGSKISIHPDLQETNIAYKLTENGGLKRTFDKPQGDYLFAIGVKMDGDNVIKSVERLF